MKKKIYISIPITGHPYRDQREKADLAARMLSKKGYIPVNPFNIYAGHQPDYYDHLTADLRALADCDGIYFCTGWEQSLGCNIEHDFVMRHIAAKRKDYEVTYEI